MIGRTEYIDLRLQELAEYEADTNDLPCGDLRAEAKSIVDKIRKEIILVEAMQNRHQSTHHVEARIEKLFKTLNEKVLDVLYSNKVA